MSLNHNKYTQPEFSLYIHKVPGVPVGRIYIPHACTNRSELLRLYQPIHIIEEKPYMNGDKVIWFVASIAVYRSLAVRFPHRKYAANTEYLLTTASTFFKALEFFASNSFTDVRLLLMLLIIVLFSISLPPESQSLLINVTFFILANQICGFFFQLLHITPQHTPNSNTPSLVHLASQL